MRKTHDSDDEDDSISDRSPVLLQTQRFAKSDVIGTKDFKATQPKSRFNEGSSFKLNLDRMNDDEDDSLDDSDDNSNTKTSRSTSSAATSQLTPKPKERSFLKKDTQKPVIKPRHTGNDDEDDDRNVFGKTNIEPSPRYQILSAREEEERNQSFMKGFSNQKKRQSPTDMFSVDHKTDSRKSNTGFSKDSNKKHTDSDDEMLSEKHSKHSDSSKSRHSATNLDGPKSSGRSKEGMENSDNEDFSYKQSKQEKRSSVKQLSRDSAQSTDSHIMKHQSSSSRPGSAEQKENEHGRRSSHCEDQDTVILPMNAPKSESRPTSAKSITMREQNRLALDAVAAANALPLHNNLTTNNESLAAALQPSSPPSPPPRASTKLPPRPKADFNATRTLGGINKKKTFKVPSRYQEIRSRIDNGRTPIADMDLSQSIQRALDKELQTKVFSRPQSARSRRQSANSDSSERRRRRSSSAYEHVQPRVNTNRSINFEELNTNQMRNDSSQSIKDAVYLEWAKAKEDRKKREHEELKRWQEENAKLVDKSTIERKVFQNAQNLEKWRQEKEEELRKKKREELKMKREQEEHKIRLAQEKKKDAKDGFDEWISRKKEESIRQKEEEERKRRTEIENEQEEKQKQILEAEKAYKKWMNKKTEEKKKSKVTTRHAQNDELKKLRENEETKFISAQEAYEKWLQEKEKHEWEEKITTKRRNSINTKQQQVPFLPGGAPKNTGKIRHVVW